MVKIRSRPMQIVNKTVPLSPRVQNRLNLVEESRFKKKPVWGEGLTVLNEQTVKLPLVKRKALAIKKVLSEMPIGIGEGELLVGFAIQGSVGACMLLPEYAMHEDRDRSGRFGYGHFCPDYSRYLKLGVSGFQKLAEKKLNETRQDGTEPEKEAWYEAVIISLDSLKELIRRYGDLASKLAGSETNLMRKGELHEITRVSQHLLEEPPQTFREALQASWFAHVAFHSTANLTAIGRFDQNLWPYLKRDLENGTITINEAQEFIDLFWLKFNERLQALELVTGTFYRSGGSMPSASTFFCVKAFRKEGLQVTRDLAYSNFSQTTTLSGLTPEGLDGTNPLTYLCLNALLRLRVPQPGVYVRFHNGSPSELYERVADCIRAGCIGPTIYNDEVVVPGYEKLGIPVEHARNYTSDGCWETLIQGKSTHDFAVIPVAGALDRVLNPASWEEVEVPFYIGAMDPFRDSKAPDPYSFRFFDEVMESFKENLDTYIKSAIERQEESWGDERLYNITPVPLFSAFIEGPLERGKDATQGGVEYRLYSPLGAGLSHAVDSLAVIKKLCFEEKAVAWSELLDAIRDNWRDKKSLRQLVRTRVPAYGNDDDYVDDIAREIVEYFVGSVRRHSAKVKKDIKFPPGLGTFHSFAFWGSLVGATPDGRLMGEPLSTNASPSVGRAVSGQTAAVNSFLKLNSLNLPYGAPLDLTFPSRAGLLSQLESFIKSFLGKGGNLLTLTVTNCEVLRAAQKEPEKYRDLQVRVGGYQAYFTDLPRNAQDFMIQRCEQ